MREICFISFYPLPFLFQLQSHSPDKHMIEIYTILWCHQLNLNLPKTQANFVTNSLWWLDNMNIISLVYEKIWMQKRWIRSNPFYIYMTYLSSTNWFIALMPQNINRKTERGFTCWVGNFWSHWYFGNGFPSAEHVKIDLLWTPIVAPPVGVTRNIFGGSEIQNRNVNHLSMILKVVNLKLF